MKTTLKIFLEFVAVFALTFMLSLEHIIIANTYSIPYLSCFFFVAYFPCCWLCHRACGIHNIRFGVAISALACMVTFFSVESILHKDEKGCQNWILEVIESATNSRLQNEIGTFSRKERSFNAALKILRGHNDNEIFAKIKACEDADVLRIIAFTADIAARPMESGTSIDFDAKMEDVFYVAMQKLFDIDSDEANEYIKCYKSAFPPDGARSMFFKECEEKRRALRSERKNVKANEPNSVIMLPQKHQP